MKKFFILFFITINASLLYAQTILSIEGTTINNLQTAAWEGVVIPRRIQTAFTYRNNSITSVNALGYMLNAGDESVGVTNNNLDDEVITGNVFTWNGTDGKSITHGIFTGYNINALVKYNYLNNVPMGILRKSNGMTDSSGGVAYNIVKNPLVAVNIKGMNGVRIYNNTLYSNKTRAQTWRGLVHVYSNNSPVAASTGTKIKNNIFYTTHLISNITIEDAASVPGFESDYNIFWCEEGTPRFSYLGATKTFSQWQALGYDTHSVVVNPDFINTIHFVPKVRLDYGTDLGAAWKSGLSADATWGFASDPDTTAQNGIWQVGSRLYPDAGHYPVMAIKNFIVKEFAPKRTGVGTVTDSGTLSTYAIVNGNTDHAFSINSSSGNISVFNNAALNYRINPLFELTVAVYNSFGQLSAYIPVNIYVIKSEAAFIPQILPDTLSERYYSSLREPVFSDDMPKQGLASATSADIFAGSTSLIHLYPNPVINGILMVQLDDQVDGFDLSIWDFSGKLILRRSDEHAKFLSLDLTAYPRGLYLVQICSTYFRVSEKFAIR